MKQIEELLESEFRVTFSLDACGTIETCLRCDLDIDDLKSTIRRAKNSFIDASGSAWPANVEPAAIMLRFNLTCWILNADCMDETIEMGLCEIGPEYSSLSIQCQQLVDKVLPRFIEAVTRQQIGWGSDAETEAA